MKFNSINFKPYKDQFNLYNLIKQINDGYRLYFDNKEKIFVIVNIYRNYEIIKTFKSFYENILHELRFSKIENLNQIIKYIDISNQELELKKESKLKNITSFISKEINQISNRSNTIRKSDLNKIIGATKC